MPEESKQSPSETPPTYDLAAINLQIGSRLQLVTERTNARQSYFATLIGYLAGEAVLVRTPMERGLSIPFQEGEPLTVRVFSGVQVFSFATFVDRISVSPFPCLYLKFPQAVSGTTLRKAMRVKVDLRAHATRSPTGESPQTEAVSLTNLSVAGGLIESEMPLGAMGDKIEVSFAFVVQSGDREVQIKAQAVIRNVKPPKTGPSQQGSRYVHGVEFVDLGPTDQAMLQNLVFEAVVAGRQLAV